MGAGKTTVGALLASRLSCAFVDVDQLVEQKAGMRISEIFAAQGEGGFRRLESEAIREIACGSYGSYGFRQVIALGGGAVLRRENRLRIAGSGVSFYLSACPKSLFSRLQGASDRPLLALRGGEELERRIETMLRARKRFYRRADFMIATDQKTPDQVALLVNDQLIMREMRGKRGKA
jgi:shikimate kinase